MRRELFIGNLAIALVAGWLCACGHAEETNSPLILAVKSRVVLVRDAGVVSGFKVDDAKVRALVVAGITALTGGGDEAAVWRHFASSNDVVGIKINTQFGPLQSTRRAVVETIVHGLRAAGVSATNIYVFDRDPLQMRAAGYGRVGVTNLVQEVSIIDGTGWDPKVYFENALAGKLIWGDLLFGKEEPLSKRSHLPKLVTETITKLINVPVYNLSFGMVDNTRRFESLGQNGDPMIAQICAMPQVRRKLVLNIMDGLVAGYAGGPGFKPQYSWNYGALYFSVDPVAVDSLCVEALDAKRREAKVPLIGPRATHIATAGHLGLGQSGRANIDLSEVKP
jgi:uncharacterized protein (DUF362 family)